MTLSYVVLRNIYALWIHLYSRMPNEECGSECDRALALSFNKFITDFIRISINYIN